MLNNLNYNNAYEQSGINYSNRGSCPNYGNKRSERGTMRTQFDNEFWNINHITHSRTARSNIWEIVVGCSAYSCMQRRSSSSSSNSRLLFNHTLTKRHLERLWKKQLYAVELQISLTASSKCEIYWCRNSQDEYYICKLCINFSMTSLELYDYDQGPKDS